jgi:two-component system, chemotaxis family, CheB/CheR fusion protein
MKRSKRKKTTGTDQVGTACSETPSEATKPTTIAAMPHVGDRAGTPRPFVVGMGASAGGLDAFKKFLAAMPSDSGLAFVLVPHLDPTHESLMVTLLAKHTAMPVAEALEGVLVEADHVYVLPPNKYMTISEGVLHLTGPVERRGLQTSIDFFLRSLADDQQERAICVILSGTGSHGTLGLKAVKAAGGMALVQDPATAEYDRMPANAVATGLADYVLTVEKMPETLLGYVRHYGAGSALAKEPAVEAEDQLSQILALLRARTRHDFRWYRKNMLRRRIERRMGLNQIDQLAAYLALLNERPAEIRQLAKDLLISVTSFFRDPEAFQVVETEIIPRLLSCKEPNDLIRVWVPGCATGEEPYSIAILLLEQIAAARKNCAVKVFATDVDEDALETARRGVYPDSITADVSPERLSKFFTRCDEQSYQVNKRLRETVVFAAQDLIGDAPFSKLDLVGCRNLLIYLEPEMQRRVISLLHFALNDGGYLLLGPSETIGRQLDLFEPVSKKWRVYRRIGTTPRDRVEIPLGGSKDRRRAGMRPPEPAVAARPLSLAELTQQLLLKKHVPAAVLINRKYEILYFAGPTMQYLDQPTGEPTLNLMNMACEGLQGKLRSAIHKAIQDKRQITVAGARVERHGNIDSVRVTVEPVAEPTAMEGLLLVTFTDEQPLVASDTAAADESPSLQLQRELEATREDLESSIEELESSNEELKASNEEVMSMNEELQSTNEELESSKEELQSLNEELNTANNQLQDKVQEIEQGHNDLANLLTSTEVPTLFLDSQLRIRRFTPATSRLLNLIEADVGRPFSDIARKFTDAGLLDECALVLQRLTPVEAEVHTDDGRCCLRRILPYRTMDDKIEGVVITFSDVTQLKQAAQRDRRLATVLMDSNDAVMVHDFQGRISAWNRGASRMYGYPEAEALSMNVRNLVPEPLRPQALRLIEALSRGESAAVLETQRLAKDGRVLDVSLAATVLRDQGGAPLAVATTERDISQQKRTHEEMERRIAERTHEVEATNRDLLAEISERKRTESALRESGDRIAAIVNSAAEGIITIDQRGTIDSFNRAAERMFGYSAAEVIGQNVKLLMPSPFREAHADYLAEYLQTGIKKIIGIGREVIGRRKDGSVFPIDLAISELQDGTTRLFTGLVRDISERNALQREVLEIATAERRRIGQDLHDDAGQELTGLRLMAQSLAKGLRDESPPNAQAAAKIADGLKLALHKVRALAKGLVPVEVDSDGLMAALSELAARTAEDYGTRCAFECPEPVQVSDVHMATQLYRIAQEAVTNAVKHAQARQIHLGLATNDTTLTLSVADDGVGFGHLPKGDEGIGLQIMRHRAALIGAVLSVSTAGDRGTRVECTLRTGRA